MTEYNFIQQINATLLTIAKLYYFSYFINHYTKATTWEDPRVRYQQIGKPVSSAASTSSKENTRHGGASQEASASEGNTTQVRYLTLTIVFSQ